jgi:hypothetical protein
MNKTQIHYSMLDMMSRCGVQFQRRYGARFGVWDTEEIIPPGVALVTGISTHKSIEANLSNKIMHKALLPVEEIQAIAADSVHAQFNGGLMLTEEEAADVSKTHDETVDVAVKLATLHYDELAPNIEPVAIEEPWVIALKDQPYDLAGRIDIREEKAIRDTKTAKASPNQDDARSMQMAVYSLAYKVTHGALPERVYIDSLVKTKTPKAVTVEATPEESWLSPVKFRIIRAIEIIDTVKSGKAAFTPADPGHWCCTKKFCGYAATCPFYSGR